MADSYAGHYQQDSAAANVQELPLSSSDTRDRETSGISSSHSSSSSIIMNTSSIMSNTTLSISIPNSTSFNGNNSNVNSQIAFDPTKQQSSTISLACMADLPLTSSLSQQYQNYEDLDERHHPRNFETGISQYTSSNSLNQENANHIDQPRRPQTTISSADYALNVVLEHFEKLASKKMFLILNMGVVSLGRLYLKDYLVYAVVFQGCRGRLVQTVRKGCRPFF
ncbi:hypothetical protein F4703DRAFT_1320079 [Phycomyces blakesleeanus]